MGKMGRLQSERVCKRAVGACAQHASATRRGMGASQCAVLRGAAGTSSQHLGAQAGV